MFHPLGRSCSLQSSLLPKEPEIDERNQSRLQNRLLKALQQLERILQVARGP